MNTQDTSALMFVAADRLEQVSKALRELLEQIESLDDFALSRDLEPYKAQACWDAALYNAYHAIGMVKS